LSRPPSFTYTEEHITTMSPTAANTTPGSATPTGRFATNQQIMRAIGHSGESHRAPHRGNPSIRAQDDVALENARLKARNEALERSLFKRDEGSGAKNKTRVAIKDLPETDKLNVARCNTKIDEEIWHKQPFRPRMWAFYTLEERSMCQEILKCGIAIPAGSDPERYWELLVRWINNKYSANKSNLFEACKKQYYGNKT
jgi:hypothetical protein